MASTDATPIPVKNQAYRVTFPILDADGDLVTAAGSLDSEVSKDGGTFADCTNEATEIATSSGMYYLDLTATEMNADTVAVIVKSTGGKTTPIVLYPRDTGADFEVDVTYWNGTAVATPSVGGVPEVDVTHWNGTAVATPDTAGIPEVMLANSANHGGAAGVLTLDHIVVSSTTNHAVDLQTTLANGHALHLEGNGTSTGIGLYAFGELTGIVGANTASSTGHGMSLTSNGSGAGLDVFSSTGNAFQTGTSSGNHLSSDIKADINGEVVDALNTDTYAEPGQAAPPATTTLVNKIGYLYKAWRNRSTQTATQYSLYNDDATTVDQKATVSDNGTTADKGEVGTGP